jgi:hypothetical protein
MRRASVRATETAKEQRHMATIPYVEERDAGEQVGNGPMPQTREHLEIVDLLGVAAGAIVLTSADRSGAQRPPQARHLQWHDRSPGRSLA